KIDNDALSKPNGAIFFENNVAPVRLAHILVSSRKIVPLHQFPRDRDVEKAVTFMRQFLCRSQNAPCPGMNRYFALKCFTIDRRNIAARMMKTHYPIHAGDGFECPIDSAVQFW